jgi:hypothetical protein
MFRRLSATTTADAISAAALDSAHTLGAAAIADPHQIPA